MIAIRGGELGTSTPLKGLFKKRSEGNSRNCERGRRGTEVEEPRVAIRRPSTSSGDIAARNDERVADDGRTVAGADVGFLPIRLEAAPGEDIYP